MHAVKMITPGTLVALGVGLVLFIVVYRLIFKERR
jgi:hypothetical protein